MEENELDELYGGRVYEGIVWKLHSAELWKRLWNFFDMQ